MSKKTVTAGQLADELGITPGRVRQLVTLGVLSRQDRNQYPLAACRAAYQKFKAAADAGSESAYLDYLKISNDLLELQNKVKRGELIHRDDFILAISNRLQTTRARLLTLPTKAAPLLVGNSDAGALSILKRLVSEARRELEAPIDFKRIALDAAKNSKRM